MTSRARAMKVAAAPVHAGCDVIGCRLHKTQEEASTIEIVHNSFGTTACSMEQQAEADCKTTRPSGSGPTRQSDARYLEPTNMLQSPMRGPGIYYLMWQRFFLM
jgi:hypothetical protein